MHQNKEEITQQIEAILQDPRAKAFFKQYDSNEENIRKFVGEYVEHREKVKKEGNKISSVVRRYQDDWEEVARDAYDAILKRKIFVKNVLWRAGKLNISEVESTFDFWKWGQQPGSCPFIEPVTDKELQLMKAFLRRESYVKEDLDDMEHWQDYDCYTNSELHVFWEVEYPHWYAFCDEHNLDIDWRSYEDVRRPKEAYYEHLVEASTDNGDKTQSSDSSVWVMGYDVVRKAKELAIFNGRQDLEQYIDNYLHLYEGQFRREVDYPIAYLGIHYKDKIPTLKHENWGEGLNVAMEQHCARLAADHFEDFHEEYLYKKTNDLLDIDKEQNHMKHIAKVFKKRILEGRKLANEPQNFNFY